MNCNVTDEISGCVTSFATNFTLDICWLLMVLLVVHCGVVKPIELYSLRAHIADKLIDVLKQFCVFLPPGSTRP